MNAPANFCSARKIELLFEMLAIFLSGARLLVLTSLYKYPHGPHAHDLVKAIFYTVLRLLVSHFYFQC